MNNIHQILEVGKFEHIPSPSKIKVGKERACKFIQAKKSLTCLPRQVCYKAPHQDPHISSTFSLLRQTSHLLNRSQPATIQLTVPIIFQILNHLLRDPLNPLGSHGVFQVTHDVKSSSSPPSMGRKF